MKFKHVLGLLCAASISAALAGAACAQDKTVKIGAIFPMSGGAASIGVHAKAAIETAMDIINNPHPELGNFPLAKNGWSCPALGGAKVEVVFADNQGSPATRPEQALRLDHGREGGRDHRRLSVGASRSPRARSRKNTAFPLSTASRSPPNLTERGFKWFFRVTPWRLTSPGSITISCRT